MEIMAYKSNIEQADRTMGSGEFPQVVLVDNCSACNLRCSMCDHSNVRKYRKIQLMDITLYRRLVDEIAVEKPAARVWEIFFGDPFLCKDMPERIKYAKSRGLKDVVLNSNGVLMTHERARTIIDAGLDAMYVGIDAAVPDTYAKIRVGGDFQLAVKNVLQYRDLLRESGSQNQKLFVQFVVSDINEGEVEAFRKFWLEAGVNVKIRPKISWAGLIVADNLQSNLNVVRKPCYWLMKTINICADGEVALCSVDLHCRVKCGNLANMTIKEAWKGMLKTYREMHREGRFDELPEMCRKCADWQSAYADFSLAGN